MKSKALVFLCAIALVVAGACKKEEAPPEATTTELAGTTNPSDVSPVVAEMWVDDFTLGHELAADGTIVTGRTGDDFAPGQAIFLAMKTTDAPAGSAVKVVWVGPNEIVVSEETKSVSGGTLNFTAPNTRSWKKGDYRVDTYVGDEKVNTQQFQIVDAAKAGK
jgi:hypothetical protein